MIEKIISSGQTAVSAVALDVAIKLGLAYGGWCREGDPVADKYRLKRLPGASVGAVIEKTVGAGQGSLYFTRGENASLRLETTKRIALRLSKPLLVLNLARENGFFASRRMAEWVGDNQIRVLHVDGDGDSTPDGVANMIEATFFLAMMDTGISSSLQPVVQHEHMIQRGVIAETVEAALDHLEQTMSLKDRATIANMAATELVSLHASLGEYINRHFDLFLADSLLLTDCRRRAGQSDTAPTDAAAIIIRALWERLRGTCRIRIVK
jgi:Circularly permutated YpsA SLOG family/Domain of unknown function (DUF6794)